MHTFDGSPPADNQDDIRRAADGASDREAIRSPGSINRKIARMRELLFHTELPTWSPRRGLALAWVCCALSGCGGTSDSLPQPAAVAAASGAPDSSGHPSPEIAGKTVDEWLATLKTFGPGVRAAEEAVPELIELATDQSTPPLLRRQVVLMLGRIGRPAVAALPALRTLLSEPPTGDDAPAAWSAKALALWGPAAAPAVPDLQSAFARDDATWETRLAILEAMSRIGAAQPAAIRFLIETLRSPSADFDALRQRELKMAAADGLTLIGPQAVGAVPVLVTELEHPHEFVRARCAAALGFIGPGAAHAVPTLAEHLVYDDDGEVRKQSALALGRIGPEAHEWLFALASDNSAEVRRLALVGLRAGGTPAEPTVQALQTALADADERVRLEAAAALTDAKLLRTEVIPALLPLVASEDRTVRIQAGRLLEQLQPTEAEWNLGPREFRIDRNRAAQQLRARWRKRGESTP